MNHTSSLRKVLIVGISCLSVIASSANAKVGDDMRDFFQGNGGYINTTGPGGYNGQTAGYYTGGSLWARTPVRSVNPINIQLPKASGGCGGIDLFAGSFSYINTDQIVSLLKATANNSIGFAFQLAIDSISAEIGGVMKDMAAKIQSINEFNMNSCEEAQALVGGIFPALEGASSTVCQTVGVGEGLFSDMARSRHGCTTGQERDTTLNTLKDPRVDVVKPRNYTWHALRNAGLDVDFSEFLMSLIGTAIYSRPNNADDNQPGTWSFERADEEGLFQELLTGRASGQVEILDCGGDTSAEGCLNPVKRTLTVPQSQSFMNMTYGTVDSIRSAIQNRRALTSNEIGFINATNIPIFKILIVNESAVTAGLSESEMEYLSQAIAVDMLIRFVRGAVSSAEHAILAAQVPPTDELREWRAQSERMRLILAQKEQEIEVRSNRAASILNRTLTLEKTLKNKLTPQLASSLNYVRGLGATSAR